MLRGDECRSRKGDSADSYIQNMAASVLQLMVRIGRSLTACRDVLYHSIDAPKELPLRIKANERSSRTVVASIAAHSS